MSKKSIIIVIFLALLGATAFVVFKNNLLDKNASQKVQSEVQTPAISKIKNESTNPNQPVNKISSMEFDPESCNIKIKTTSETVTITTRYNETGNKTCKDAKVATSENGAMGAYIDKGLTSDTRYAMYQSETGKVFFINIPNGTTTESLKFIGPDRLIATQATQINRRQVSIYNLPANLSAYTSAATDLNLTDYTTVIPAPPDTTKVDITSSKIIFYDTNNITIRSENI